MIGGVEAGIGAGEDLRGCYERVQRTMQPDFGEWPVFQGGFNWSTQQIG